MSEERKTIYLCLAHMSEEGLEQKYVKEAFDTNWVVPMGPNVNAFEEDLRKFVTGNVESKVYRDSSWLGATPSTWHLDEKLKDTKVICLSAGTAAVHLALIACGVKSGDEVCVQSFTFCASSHPITYLGAKPIFIDSERETWNMDPELLEKAILDRKEKTGKYPKAITQLLFMVCLTIASASWPLPTSTTSLLSRMQPKAWARALTVRSSAPSDVSGS